MTESFVPEDYKFEKPTPQQDFPKTISKPLIALKSCKVEFDNAIVELKKGTEVHGLSRAERDYLKVHHFVE